MNGKAPTYLEDLFRSKETVNQTEFKLNKQTSCSIAQNRLLQTIY